MRSFSLFSLTAALVVLSGCANMRSGGMAEQPMASPSTAAMPPATMATGPIPPAMALMEVRPIGPPPDWAPNIDPQMLAFVEQFRSFEAPPFPEMTAFQARMAKTATEAVQALAMKAGMPPSPPAVDIAHRILPVGSPEGTLVRMYTPLSGSGPRPVIVYYHGGGWVIAGLDTYEPSAIALAQQTGAVVVSVAYRLAPDNKFPTQHEDSFAAYQWVTQNAAQIGGDPSRIATAGESAGGNLAVAVALMAKQRGARLPVHILSVYPIADGDTQSPSYDQYASAIPLNRPAMQWFFDKTLASPADARNPLISLTSADLSGMPPVTIVNAQLDPLQSEGGELEDALRRAGVDVQRRVFDGVTHEFFGMATLLEQAVQAQQFASQRLRGTFGM